jgi:hypothetical protein
METFVCTTKLVGQITQEFVTLKIRRKYPLVLLVRLGWRQGITLGSDESTVIGNCIVSIYRRGKKLSIWVNFNC